jgi:hypothetical protein
MAVTGFALGLPLNYWAAAQWHAAGFGIPAYFGYIASTQDPGRFLVAAGYIGIVMLAVQANVGWFVQPLAAVGRMALSNYLLTSLLMTLFFDGTGLGQFARWERAELYRVVLGMWVINLAWSPLWLRHFRYGRPSGCGVRLLTGGCSRCAAQAGEPCGVVSTTVRLVGAVGSAGAGADLFEWCRECRQKNAAAQGTVLRSLPGGSRRGAEPARNPIHRAADGFGGGRVAGAVVVEARPRSGSRYNGRAASRNRAPGHCRPNRRR